MCEIGVSRTALYRHFTDEAALVAGIAADGFRLLCDTLKRVRANAPAGATDTLEVMAAAHVHVAAANPSHYATMFGGYLKDWRALSRTHSASRRRTRPDCRSRSRGAAPWTHQRRRSHPCCRRDVRTDLRRRPSRHVEPPGRTHNAGRSTRSARNTVGLRWVSDTHLIVGPAQSARSYVQNPLETTIDAELAERGS